MPDEGLPGNSSKSVETKTSCRPKQPMKHGHHRHHCCKAAGQLQSFALRSAPGWHFLTALVVKSMHTHAPENKQMKRRTIRPERDIHIQ
jgi:hypothetical protein